MEPGDAGAASGLIQSTFLEFIAPTYRPRGVRWFLRHNTPRALRARLRKGQLVLVAEAQGRLAGIAAVRSGSHLSLLFVDPELHGQGIGRGLFREALKRMGDERGSQLRRPEGTESTEPAGRGGSAGTAETAMTTQAGQTAVTAVTVNSSDFAVPFYAGLGFRAAGGPRYKKGMKITPMRLEGDRLGSAYASIRSNPAPSGP